METLYPSIQYVNRLMVHSWGQKVIRFYDLDGNLIEVGNADVQKIREAMMMNQSDDEQIELTENRQFCY